MWNGGIHGMLLTLKFCVLRIHPIMSIRTISDWILSEYLAAVIEREPVKETEEKKTKRFKLRKKKKPNQFDIACRAFTLFTAFTAFTLQSYTSYRIFTVRNFRQFPWPPIDHETPLFSMKTCSILVANAPLPAVNESPIAATTSMSPGRRRCTVSGMLALRAPAPFLVSQKNSVVLASGFCTFCRFRFHK